MKILIRAAASLRQPIGTREAMECAQNVFMLPDNNIEWTEQISKMIRTVWNDSGMRETFAKKGESYTLEDPRTVVYICENLERITDINYHPNQQDIEMTRIWSETQDEPVAGEDKVEEGTSKYTNEEKNIAKGGIQDTLFREVKSLVLKAAQSKVPFGSHEALTCARHTLTLNEETLEWNTELQQTLEVLWEDSGIRTVYTEKNYFLENFKRIAPVDYSPTDDDVAKLEELYANEPEPEVAPTPTTTPTPTPSSPNNTNNPTTTNVTNTNTQNITNNNSQQDLLRKPSQTISITNPGEQALQILMIVPSLNITKLLKAGVTEKAPELIEKLRKKPGVTLEQNVNYICWANRSGFPPVVMDVNAPLLTFNLKNNDSITLLKAGEKPEDVKFKSFHNTQETSPTLSQSKKDKKPKKPKEPKVKKIKDSKKKKKDSKIIDPNKTNNNT